MTELDDLLDAEPRATGPFVDDESRGCDYMLTTILEVAPLSLIWLVEHDRISITKAFRILAEDDPIEALKQEFVASGWVQGMTNAEDLNLIPQGLKTVERIRFENQWRKDHIV